MRSKYAAKARWILTIAAVAGGLTHAAQLQVSVLDNGGKSVADAVVVAVPIGSIPARTDQSTTTMDQIEKRFVPDVLVVRVGTSVSFPNSDSVAHQVYSFSPPKRFTLPLYRGRTHPPLLFDQPGLVVLGCNIHDQMVGYVYVTESPYFGKTDSKGQLNLSTLPVGTYRVTVWHPRFDEEPAPQDVMITEVESAQSSFRLQRALRPKPSPTPADERIRDY